MDIKFESVKELYFRLKPALIAKETELKREGYEYIKHNDIWNYLKETKWIKDSALALHEMTDDILKADKSDIDLYVKGKMKALETNAILDDRE